MKHGVSSSTRLVAVTITYNVILQLPQSGLQQSTCHSTPERSGRVNPLHTSQPPAALGVRERGLGRSRSPLALHIRRLEKNQTRETWIEQILPAGGFLFNSLQNSSPHFNSPGSLILPAEELSSKSCVAKWPSQQTAFCVGEDGCTKTTASRGGSVRFGFGSACCTVCCTSHMSHATGFDAQRKGEGHGPWGDTSDLSTQQQDYI